MLGANMAGENTDKRYQINNIRSANVQSISQLASYFVTNIHYLP